MAKKYVNFRVGGSPQKVNEDYSVWTNDLLAKSLQVRLLFSQADQPLVIS